MHRCEGVTMATIYKAGKGYRAIIRRKGETPMSKNFTAKIDAVKWARSIEVEADQKNRLPSGMGITVGACVRIYRDSLRAGYGTTKDWNMRLIEQELGHLKLNELSRHRLTQFVSKRENAGAGPSTNGQTIGYLRTCIKYGGGMLDADDGIQFALANISVMWATMMHTGQLGHSVQRNRRPTEDELEKLFDYFDTRPKSNTPMTDIISFAIATCMRRGEIISHKSGIRWEDFDEQRRTVLIRRRKDPTTSAGRDMEVPLLSGHVVILNKKIDPVEIMLRQKTARKREGRVFPYADPTICLSFIRACEALKIEDLRFHDLRHDGISRMFERGYNIAQVAAVSGHKSWKNLQRYTHIDAASLHTVLM